MTFAARWTALIVLVGCADGLPNAHPPALHDVQSATAPLRKASAAVVRIQHPAGTSGTGSFISADGLLLTNAHVLGGDDCAREGCTIGISFQHQRGTQTLGGREVFAVPQHVDVGLDMAVLQIFLDEAKTERINTINFLSLDPRTAEELLGEHVTAIGHPLGRLKKWSDGYVIDADGEWFDTTVFSLPGGSGSPILSDTGLLVGLLHRGAEGFDLLTRTSTQVTAIASASADLQRALAAPLPDSVISLAQPLSSDEAMTHSAAFLAASTWKANVAGQQVSLVSLFAAACDEGIARDDYTSLEALQGALSPCFSALDFIECRRDVGEQLKAKPKECPDAIERLNWMVRLQTVADKQQRFNGSLDLSSVSFSTEVLADSQVSADVTSRESILATLDRLQPKLDFSIGSYLAAYGIESYDNQNTRDFFLHYSKVPFYERYAWQIVTSALWLYTADLMSNEETLRIAKDLYRDNAVSIGAKLRIEEVLYNADAL